MNRYLAMTRRPGLWCALLLTPLLASAASVSRAVDENEIRAALNAQIEAWNRGDLEGFMNVYWQSPDLVYISNKTVIRGWQPMLDLERRTYKTPGGKEMGRLALPDMEISILGEDAALIWGTYTITTPMGGGRGGLYTLVTRKLPEGWRVVYDRTSSEAPANAAGSGSTNRNVTVQKTLAPEKQLQFDVEIPATLDDVWAALATSDGMKTWIAPDARVDLRVGGDWLVLFPGAAPGGGRITGFAPPTELVIHAMAPERFPEVRSRGTSAAFTLARCGPTCTHVRLTQTGWQNGKEWDEAFEYLSNGNAALLEQLRRRFIDGPLKWSR